jgi:hypothetical protein
MPSPLAPAALRPPLTEGWAGPRHSPCRASRGLGPRQSDLWDRDILIDSTIFALEQMQLGSVITKRMCLEVA